MSRRWNTRPVPELSPYLLTALLLLGALVGCGGDTASSGGNVDPDADRPDATDPDAGFGDTDLPPDADMRRPPPEQGSLAMGEFETPGTITRLEVTGADGEPQSSYGVRHPIDIAVDIDPADGWETRLAGHPNLHVGLVETVESERDRADAETCYLGSLTHRGKSAEFLDDGKVRFQRRYFVPKHCLAEGDSSGSFNVWVALNPARFLPGESLAIPERDFNTQFFNPLFDDTEDEGRNQACTGAGGQDGCVYTLEVELIEGFNIITAETDLASDVFVFNPAACDSSEPNFANGLAAASTTLQIGGTSPALEAAAEYTRADALEAAGVESVGVTYELCPRNQAGSCADGHDYQPIDVSESDDGDEGTLVNAMQVDAMSVGSEHVAEANLYVGPGDLCESLAGWRDVDWSDYRLFNLRTCVDPGFDETAPDGETDADNCALSLLRMVHIDETPDGQGPSSGFAFTSDWGSSVGGDVLEAYASFGSKNRLDTDGAANQTHARAGIDGWVSFALFDVELEARSQIDGSRSGVDAHVDVFNTRRWSFHEQADAVSLAETVDYAKQACKSYNYGVAGIGLNASLCAEGRAGFELHVETDAADEPGAAPFDEAERHGGIDNLLEPFAAFSLIATASADALLAQGGIEGTIDLVTAELPIVSDLKWGRVSGPAVVTTWEVGTDLVITFLNGTVDVFVDLARPGWCDCGTLCGYPCRRWENVVDERLLSFDGPEQRIPLLSESNTSGATLTD